MPDKQVLNSHSAETAPPLTASESAEVQRELHRLLDSPEFHGSERGKSLLRYLVDNALNGSLEHLKERTIGVELFSRAVDYDTGQDAIVRVSVNSLRKRLTAYYTRTEGSSTGSHIQITLAPGSYTPEFLPVEPHAIPAPPHQLPAAQPRWRKLISPVFIVLLAGISLWLGWQNVKLKAPPPSNPLLVTLPWSMMQIHNGVISTMTDANYVIHHALTHNEMDLGRYLDQGWVDDLKKAPGMSPLTKMPYTSVVSAVASAKISLLLGRVGIPVSVRSSRNLAVADLKSEKAVILLGNRRTNPWVALFADRLNFTIEPRQGFSEVVCLNKAPLPGESPMYIATAGTPKAGVSWATIALLQNISAEGWILIIAGTNAEGTEAAADLVTDVPRLAEVLRTRGIDPAAKAKHLELLMRLECLNLTTSRTEIVAHRVSQ